MSVGTIFDLRRDACGPQYLDEAGLRRLAVADRLQPVLVKMEGCRFVCPAQDAQKIIRALESAGDFCRTVEVSQ